MTARYRILSSANLKYVVVEGRTTYEELESLFFRYLRDPEFTPDLHILVDLRRMTDAIAGLWEIRKMKELYRYAYNDTIGAVNVVIVTSTGIAYRAARAFQLVMRDKKPLVVQITDSVAKAQEILKLSDQVMVQLGLVAQTPKGIQLSKPPS